MLLVNGSLGFLLGVFGAIIMGLEILASNLMSPFFGGSVYVWGSIISSYMVHMSLGYALGGWLARRSQRLSVLLWLLALGSLAVLLTPSVHKPLCGFLADHIDDVRYGSLAAMMLLASPILLLAMICPYTIEIFARLPRPAGLSAGVVMLISTFGSFAGTNLTSFFLIDLYPVSTIVRALGATGLAVALLLLALNLDRRLPAVTGSR